MKTLVQLCLACAIVALAAFVGRQLQTPTSVVVWDAGQYGAMATQFAAGSVPYAESPYVFRVGVPWLVSKLWAGDPKRGFFVVNLLSAFAIAMLLTAWLRAWATVGWIPLAMVALFASAWHGPARYLFYNPVYVDPPFIALLLVGLLLIKSMAERFSIQKVVLLTALSTVGALVRETMVLVPMSFLLVNGPVRAFASHRRSPRPVPGWALIPPLVASIGAVAWTHAIVTVDTAERASMLEAAYQWIHKAPDSYLMGWLTAFGPVLAIIAFDGKRAARFLAEHEWLAAFLLACVALAFIGGSDTERFAFWSLPVVYLLLARGVEHHAVTLRSTYLVTALVVSQAVSARVFWGIPDPLAESVVALSQGTGWADSAYGVLNRLFVIDSFHFNLWSSFGSRPFRLVRLALYVVVIGGFVWAMRRSAGASAGSLALNDGEVQLRSLGGARHRAEDGGIVE